MSSKNTFYFLLWIFLDTMIFLMIFFADVNLLLYMEILQIVCFVYSVLCYKRVSKLRIFISMMYKMHYRKYCEYAIIVKTLPIYVPRTSNDNYL